MKSRVFEIIAAEQARQNSTVELIASENFVSENVMKAVGSCLTNKYSEGYPAQRPSGNRGRFYGGCQYVDELEEYCCRQWQAVFQTDYHVNVQPHSGSSANLAAYMSVLKPGDTILAMILNNGGHLTHGSPVNFSGKLFHMEFYGVDENGFIDYEDVRRKARECRPQLILAGASAYSRTIDFPAFADAAREAGAYFMVDMAHIAGLVAAGDHPSPFGLADRAARCSTSSPERPSRRRKPPRRSSGNTSTPLSATAKPCAMNLSPWATRWSPAARTITCSCWT